MNQTGDTELSYVGKYSAIADHLGLDPVTDKEGNVYSYKGDAGEINFLGVYIPYIPLTTNQQLADL